MTSPTHYLPEVRLSALALAWFYALLSVMLVFSEVHSAWAWILLIFGYSLGVHLCWRFGSNRGDLGLVPLGALGIALCWTGAFGAMRQTFPALNQSNFFSEIPHYAPLLWLFWLGLAGALYRVPLQLYLQSRAIDESRPRLLAWTMRLNALMSGSLVLLLGILSIFFPSFYTDYAPVCLTILHLCVTLFIFYKMPEFVIRVLAWFLVRVMYRLRAKNMNNIPDHGAALLICNHVTFVDAFILGTCSPRPPRFVMYHGYWKIPVLQWFFRAVKAIPIAPAHENEKLMNAAFDEISKALRAGDVVCIFPEGKLTRTGEMNGFKTGIEKILRRDPVPVVPMVMNGLWGSVFSYGRNVRPRKQIWRKIICAANAPLSAETAMNLGAAGLESRVRALLAENHL